MWTCRWNLGESRQGSPTVPPHDIVGTWQHSGGCLVPSPDANTPSPLQREELSSHFWK